MRTSAKTRDYFIGYSVVEAIEDRINRIGKDPKKDEDPDEMGPGWALTDIAKLNRLKVLLLGDEDNEKNKGALHDAKNIKEILKLKKQDDATKGSTGGP